MRLPYKLALASIFIGLEAWVCAPGVVAMFSQEEPRTTGLAFRFAPGDLPHVMRFNVDSSNIEELKQDPSMIILESKDGLRVTDVSPIYGFVGKNHLGASMRVSTVGAEVTMVEGGPTKWEWLFRPAVVGNTMLRWGFSGPAPFKDSASWDVSTYVRNRFGLTIKQENRFVVVQGFLGTLGVLVAILVGWKNFRQKPN